MGNQPSKHPSTFKRDINTTKKREWPLLSPKITGQALVVATSLPKANPAACTSLEH